MACRSAPCSPLPTLTTRAFRRGLQGVRARAGSEAADYIAERGLAEKGAPPVVGAVAGGVVNLLFMDHFQEVARGHFVVKRLENTYGAEAVRETYERLVI